MNGLKIYLKSGMGRVYYFAQIAVALLLLMNAFKQFESVHEPILEVMLNLVGGGVLLMGAALPSRIRAKLRYLPGLLIAGAGGVLFWNSFSQSVAEQINWLHFIYYLGLGLIVMGIGQPILDPHCYVFFSPRSVRIKRGPLGMRRIPWEEVKHIDVMEKSMEITLSNGRMVRLAPAQAASNNLRARIDEMYREMRNKPRPGGEFSPG